MYLVALPSGILAYLTAPELELESSQSNETSSTGGVRGLAVVFIRTPLLLLVYGLYFAMNALLYVITIYYPQLLSRFGVSSPFTISLYLATIALTGGVSAYFYGQIRQRLDYRQLTLTSLFLWAVGFGIAGSRFDPLSGYRSRTTVWFWARPCISNCDTLG